MTLKNITRIRNLFLWGLSACCCLISPSIKASGTADWGSMQISYIREVGNQLFLSDFQIGTDETIKDSVGHGFSLGWFLFNEGTKFFLFNVGYSDTSYFGTVEDGVNVSFVPTSGPGFDVQTGSNNILYDVDLQFQNPYISLSYTNWDITRASIKSRSDRLLPSTYGIGLIFQKAKGNVGIKALDGSQIAEAAYESGTRKFAMFGWDFNFEFMYISIVLRYVESPVLRVNSCNISLVGSDACDKILAATGNRNISPTIFTGGVLSVGFMF